jgi:hypothetical protein
MRFMKSKKKIYLFIFLLAASCNNEPQDEVDLDQMVFSEEENQLKALERDPTSSPQEILIKEPPQLN